MISKIFISMAALAALLPGSLCAQKSKGSKEARKARERVITRAVGSLFSGRKPRRAKGVGEARGLAALERLEKLGAGADLAGCAQDLRALKWSYLAARSRGGPLVKRVDELRRAHRVDFARGLRRERDPLALVLVAIDDHLSRTLAAGELKAHPSAAIFPGAVPAAAPRVSTRIEIDTKAERWRSTGLYVPAGEVVEVVFPPGTPAGRYKVLVGCHKDSIMGRPRWLRLPRITRQFAVPGPGPLQVASAFGGLLYLLGGAGAEPGRIEVAVRGAVHAPRYVRGVTKLEEWRRAIRRFPAPFGELCGRRIILSLPSSSLRALDNPEEVLRFWDRVVEVQDELACYQRTSPERFVFDRQISVGYMHSGYPLMGPVSAAPRALDLKTLREKGNWGMFHEIGHNHQTVHFGSYANPWTFDGNIEVTVNIFASYTYVAALNKPRNMGHQHWRTDLLAGELAKNFKRGPYREKSHHERCLFWVHLIEEFGWEGMHKVFAAYAKLPRARWPKTDLDKRSLLLVIFSREVGRNLTRFFDDWGLETTPAARERVEDLPPFEPRIALPIQGKV